MPNVGPFDGYIKIPGKVYPTQSTTREASRQ